MFRMIGLAMALAWLGGGMAMAEIDVAGAEACFVDAASAGTDPADCIDAAHDICLSTASETPAVTIVCLNDAQRAWANALGPRINDVIAGVEEPLGAVIRIETKYDMLTNLIQCDRIEELSIVGSAMTREEITLQKSRCTSAATGLTYMRLYLRTQPAN